MGRIKKTDDEPKSISAWNPDLKVRQSKRSTDDQYIEPYQLLANAIVKQACEDIMAYWTMPETAPGFLRTEHNRATAESFLRSKNLSIYTSLDGEYLLNGTFEMAIDKFRKSMERNALIEAETDPKKRRRLGKPIDVAGWRIIEYLNQRAIEKNERTGKDVDICCDNCGKPYHYRDIGTMKEAKIPYRFTGAKFLCPECCRKVAGGATLDVILEQIDSLKQSSAALHAYLDDIEKSAGRLHGYLDNMDDKIDGTTKYIDDLKAPAKSADGTVIPPYTKDITSDSLVVDQKKGGERIKNEPGADEKQPPDQH